MKRPEQLDPPYTADDIKLIETFETEIEDAFRADPAKPFAVFSEYSFQRRHWIEFFRWADEAGWSVEERQSGFIKISRPLRGTPAHVRFQNGRPASNVGLLVTLLGRSAVEAVFDPYLDDRGVQLLLTMANLGVTFSSELRLLTRTNRQSKLTKVFVEYVTKEIAAAKGQLRLTAGSGHENRLFLLGGGDVVAVGCSLNNLDVNERPSRGGDQGDAAWFATEWEASAAF